MLNGTLYEPAMGIILLVEGEALHNYCASNPAGLMFKVTFYRGMKEYAFEGKFNRTLIKSGKKMAEIAAFGIMTENARRATRRFDMVLDVEFIPQNASADRDHTYSGQSYDVSCDGIGLMTNVNLDISDKRYIMNFTLYGKDNFSIPAKILRKKNVLNASAYKYDYAFLFDYSQSLKEKSRLLDTFIKNSLEGYKI